MTISGAFVLSALTALTALSSASVRGTSHPQHENRGPGVADSALVPHSGDDAPSPNSQDGVTIVPFQLINGLILVPGEINGRRGLFMLDIGYPYSELNREFWHLTKDSSADTVADTRSDTLKNGEEIPVTVHTIRLGTLRYQISAADMRISKHAVAATITDNIRAVEQTVGRPLLGDLGLSALAPFETIFDYQNQRLILIRLDSAGHRLTPVPTFTPKWTTQLHFSPEGIIGIRAKVDSTIIDLALDTGTRFNVINPAKRQTLTGYKQTAALQTAIVDHLMVGDRSFDAVKFWNLPIPVSILGVPFLRSVGLWGINLRTKQWELF